ncbi:hypothetical protein [Stenotrophomonas muris]|uniref:hypothetical protein n=1 Tax=Stenotrophomonas muris TaxID=2963283 RepID=UPI00383A64BE
MNNVTDELFEDLPDQDLEAGYQLDPAKPLVLLLGWVDHEGILSSLKASGRQYKKKLLDSLPRNWESTVDIFSQYKVTAVVGKIPAHVLSLVVDARYAGIRDRLFSSIGAIPNQIFMFEAILEGGDKKRVNENYDSYPPAEKIQEAIDFLRGHGVQILPYTSRAEVTVLAESFLDDIDKNLILRMYVPRGRLWASETDRFLQLFQDYVTGVERLEVRLDQKRTEYGVIYEFHGNAAKGQKDLQEEFKEFSKIMGLFEFDADAAESLLAERGSNVKEIARLVSKYSKEAKRLQLDLKHEAESKSLFIRHRLESELMDLNPTTQEWLNIQGLVDGAIPRFGSFSGGALAIGRASDPLKIESVCINNFRPVFIETLNGIIAEEINGDQHFEPEHHQLMELISRHGADKVKELEAAVYEVADKGVGGVGRLRAKQKILAFLVEFGKKTGDVAFGVLQAYVEKKLGL